MKQLSDLRWSCSSCGEAHTGMMDLAAFAPDPWRGPGEYAPNSDIALDGDFLSEDFCVLSGRDYFVRCVLEMPVQGYADRFGIGVWSTLSRTNFDLYLDHFDEGAPAGLGPWTGYLSNDFPFFGGSWAEPLWVHPQPDRQRPKVFVHDEHHMLAVAQREGITAEQLMAFYAANGHGPA